jgi:hypothetical protein
MVVSLLPTAKSSAISLGFFIHYLDPQVTCTAAGGDVRLLNDTNVPAGYRWRDHFVRISQDSLGNMDIVTEWVQATDRYRENEVRNFYTVPADGSITDTFEVYTPGGVLVSSVTVYASCPDGTIRVTNFSLDGINQPAAEDRVMAHVQFDTPVYAQANPATPLADTLKAGQTWFVVNDTTGTDGALWYEVFVGGPQNAYIPANTVTLDGPVPE